MVRVLGIDPGLQRTGWGVIDLQDNRMRHVANGVVSSTQSLSLAERLDQLHTGLMEVIETWTPDEAAVEETFVNKNPVSTLKLGQARGVALLAPARSGIPVTEYTPNAVKKTVVGAGHAAKQQVEMMVSTLLPGCEIAGADAADALAVAICHAQHAGNRALAATMAAKPTGNSRPTGNGRKYR
ncbi:MAG: crossover junction endodeoxyribonuclease RuvC [Thalassospira sp.]|uniref:crossover junction endodeoxyribonuclease RuvC n=1 Tax=Thalassospira sp. GB04J01 TaxID=1485225 RepID=UPI000C0DB556|nr:crossover junction endodeoxyribonuclease RuvC [Thalassospira sp. GB04J01]MBV17769.1 crossover junction endodeoxyribonuclease RuvC [Thalassospira sp.]